MFPIFLDKMSAEDNQPLPQEENGTTNSVDVPEIELIIKVKGLRPKLHLPDGLDCRNLQSVCPAPSSASVWSFQIEWGIAWIQSPGDTC